MKKFFAFLVPILLLSPAASLHALALQGAEEAPATDAAVIAAEAVDIIGAAEPLAPPGEEEAPAGVTAGGAPLSGSASAPALAVASTSVSDANVAFHLEADGTGAPGGEMSATLYVDSPKYSLATLKCILNLVVDGVDHSSSLKLTSCVSLRDDALLSFNRSNNEVAIVIFGSKDGVTVSDIGVKGTRIPIVQFFFDVEDGAVKDAVKTDPAGAESGLDGHLPIGLTIDEAVVVLDPSSTQSVEVQPSTIPAVEPAPMPIAHTHTYLNEAGDYINAVRHEPTCETEGKDVYTCELCGASEETIFSDPLREDRTHQWQATGETRNPNPDVPCSYGEQLYRCAEPGCGAEEWRIEDGKQSHTFTDSSHHPRKAATETAPGNIEYYQCDVCKLCFTKGGSEANTSTLVPAANGAEAGSVEATVLNWSGGRIPGDADDNGRVSGNDAVQIKRYVAGYTAEDGNIVKNMENADCDINPGVSGGDAIAIMRTLAGYDTNIIVGLIPGTI